MLSLVFHSGMKVASIAKKKQKKKQIIRNMNKS